MTDSMEAVRRPPRAPIPRSQLPRSPMRRRSRRRWAIAGGVAACWLVLWMATGSLLVGTVMLLVLALIGGGLVLGLRMLGVTREHPWVQGMATRPWRDGQDVLQLALRHLPEVFVVTPNGALLAPNAIELRLNPRDYDSLAERIDIGLAASTAADMYAEQAAAHEARFAGYGPAEVTLFRDPAVPAGRYQLRQGQPLGASPRPAFQPATPYGGSRFEPAGAPADAATGPPASGPGEAGLYAARPPQSRPGAVPGNPGAPYPAGPLPGSPAPSGTSWPFADEGSTTAAPAGAATHQAAGAAGAGLPTVAEPARNPVPQLRLVTGDYVSQTRTSGARAGRGAVELALPDVPTVSREHARFTYSDGQWWIANLGLNGLMLNGSSLAGEHPLHDGDSIRWGRNQDAPESRVEIG
jgi:hypothetical protein